MEQPFVSGLKSDDFTHSVSCQCKDIVRRGDATVKSYLPLEMDE